MKSVLITVAPPPAASGHGKNGTGSRNFKVSTCSYRVFLQVDPSKVNS